LNKDIFKSTNSDHHEIGFQSTGIFLVGGLPLINVNSNMSHMHHFEFLTKCSYSATS